MSFFNPGKEKEIISLGSPQPELIISFSFPGLKKAQLSNTKKNAIFKKLLKKENHIYHSRKMLSGTSTDSRKLSCSRATALEQEKTSSQSRCQKAYFPVHDSNSYL